MRLSNYCHIFRGGSLLCMYSKSVFVHAPGFHGEHTRCQKHCLYGRGGKKMRKRNSNKACQSISHSNRHVYCMYVLLMEGVCTVSVWVCVCVFLGKHCKLHTVLCTDWWLLSMQAYIFEWIGVIAHEQTQDGRLWNSPLQRIARLSAPHIHTLSRNTHTHTPHPQIHFPTSSAWRSTCQLLPVAGKDGLCWFCEAHRQDPPGDCRSPAAQASALSTPPHRQSVFYIARLYHCTMHYRTAIEQEIKLGDRYLAEENELVWSSFSTYKDH